MRDSSFQCLSCSASPLPSGLPRRRREEAFNGREELIQVERFLHGQQPPLFDSIFSLLQRGAYNERRNSFQLFSRMQSVIEDDAIGVREAILQQQELRLHMLSKVPCCPASPRPEDIVGGSSERTCVNSSVVVGSSSTRRITFGEDAPLRGRSPVSCRMQHLLVIFGSQQLFPTRRGFPALPAACHTFSAARKLENGPIGFLRPLDQLLAPNPRNSRWETNANLHVVATHPLLLFV